MLARNTAVSCLIFGLNLALLYALVERGGLAPLLAAMIAFVIANSFQYVLARNWIFAGTERGVVTGFVYTLFNTAIGLGVTMALYWAVIHFTAVNYLTGRVLVSLVSGLIVFVLNATLNFRRI